MSGAPGERRPPYRRNPRLEELLRRLNAEIEGNSAEQPESATPLLFVVGAPRSGATLLMQWLARGGAFAYPTNFIARFWSRPSVGARVQAMLTEPEYDFRGELAEVRPATVGFTSDAGKTEGFLAPNEFWYFWRRFFPFGEIHRLNGDELRRLDAERLQANLRSLAAVAGKPLGKPFVLKAHLVVWHLDLLAEIFPEARFLDLERDPFFVMQSLLETRRRVYGSAGCWYSIRPPEYPRLARLPPSEQVAGQVLSIRRAVERRLTMLAPERWARVGYDELCARPAAVAERIGELFPAEHLCWAEDALQPGFESADVERLDPAEAKSLREAYRRLERVARV